MPFPVGHWILQGVKKCPKILCKLLVNILQKLCSQDSSKNYAQKSCKILVMLIIFLRLCMTFHSDSKLMAHWNRWKLATRKLISQHPTKNYEIGWAVSEWGWEWHELVPEWDPYIPGRWGIPSIAQCPGSGGLSPGGTVYWGTLGLPW